MNSRSAFTLIELIVVISIIALMIAILLPALRASRQTALVMQCASNQRSVGMTFYVYSADYGEIFPPGMAYLYKYADFQGSEVHSPYAGTARPFASAVVPGYITTPEILYCPENGQQTAARGWYRNDRWKLTFAEIGYLLFQNVYRGQTYSGHHETVGRSPEKVTNAADPGDWPMAQDLTPVPGNGLLVGAFYNNHPDAEGVESRGANVLFVDGHVAWSGIEGLTHVDVGAYYELPPVSP